MNAQFHTMNIPNLNIVNFYQSKSLLKKLIRILKSKELRTFIPIHNLPIILRKKVFGTFLDISYVHISPLMKLDH